MKRLLSEGELEAADGGHDPWGEAYFIVCNEDDIAVMSSGPDRRWDGDDDSVAPPPTRVPWARTRR